MTNTVPVGGFQATLLQNFTNIENLIPEYLGNMTNDGYPIVHFELGSGILSAGTWDMYTITTGNDDPICVTPILGLITSDPDGIPLPTQAVDNPCDDETVCECGQQSWWNNYACNWSFTDSTICLDEDICEYPTDLGFGECDNCQGVCRQTGECVDDDCGICAGDGVDNNDCCPINNNGYDNGTGPWGEFPDCFGVCGGGERVDDCGVCGGDNEDKDCFGVCFGDAVEDCTGECGGSAVEDMCGTCGGDGNCDPTFDYGDLIPDPMGGYQYYCKHKDDNFNMYPQGAPGMPEVFSNGATSFNEDNYGHWMALHQGCWNQYDPRNHFGYLPGCTITSNTTITQSKWLNDNCDTCRGCPSNYNCYWGAPFGDTHPGKLQETDCNACIYGCWGHSADQDLYDDWTDWCIWGHIGPHPNSYDGGDYICGTGGCASDVLEGFRSRYRIVSIYDGVYDAGGVLIEDGECHTDALRRETETMCVDCTQWSILSNCSDNISQCEWRCDNDWFGSWDTIGNWCDWSIHYAEEDSGCCYNVHCSTFGTNSDVCPND
jgi:hypothetical protein